MGSLPLSQEERDLGGLRLAAARRAWERALDRIPHPVRELAAAAPRAGRLSARRPRAVALARLKACRAPARAPARAPRARETDPRSAIAAAALAASLRFGGSGVTGKKDSFDIYQGTAMGRPSLIQVLDLERDDDGKLSFGLQGRVEIDATCTMEVSE